MKILNNVKKYFEYRRNRRYVKMEMMKYKVIAFQALSGLLENENNSKKLNEIRKNGKELLNIIKQLEKQGENNGINK